MRGMPRRNAVFAGLVALLGLVLGLTISPAYADSYVHRDTAKDVVRIPRDGGSCTDCQGTDRPDADIVRFRADYGHQIRLTMTLAAVPERGTVVWLIRYAPKTWLTVGIHRTRSGEWECGMALSTKPTEQAPCFDDMEWRVERDRAVFHLVMSARHVRRARSIRVGAGSMSWTGANIFVDDAMRTKYDPLRGGLAFTAGPSIPRG